MNTNIKFVRFDDYCFKCIHSQLRETADPCNLCLVEPVNQDSHQPVFFKEKDKEEK